MSIRIITDSGSDISQAEAASMNIDVLPLKTYFGAEEFLDGVTLSHHDFYQKLVETDIFPTTSQVSPYEYGKIFEKYPGDDIICITISAKLSGCFQSAAIAADDCDSRIEIIDSANVSVGERLLVELATILRDKGLSIDEIVAQLKEQASKIRIIALLDTLEYLKKGGRISPTVAIAGNLLSIKPVVTVRDGEVALVGTARGSKNGNNKLNELIKNGTGVRFDMPFHLGYTGLSDALLQKYIADSASLYAEYEGELPISTIGCAIGTHVGPGAIAAAFFTK